MPDALGKSVKAEMSLSPMQLSVVQFLGYTV